MGEKAFNCVSDACFRSGVNLVAILLFWDARIFEEWVKYCGNSLLFDVKINENRHEEWVKVAGCSFRSSRRSNILVFIGFDLCITGSGSGDGWVVTLHLVPGCFHPRQESSLIWILLLLPLQRRKWAGFSWQCYPRKAWF